MFRSTFHPAYYKKLHRYVHKVFRKKAGKDSLRKILAHPFGINKNILRSALLTMYYLPAEFVDRISLKKLESIN